MWGGGQANCVSKAISSWAPALFLHYRNMCVCGGRYGVWGLCLGVEDGVCGGIVWRRDIVCGEVGKGVVWGKVEVRVP